MPLLAGLFIPFFAFAAAIILVGMSQSHTAQHGSSGVKGFLETIIHNNIVVQLFGLAKKATAYAISHFAAAQLRHLARWLVAMGTLSSGFLGVSAFFAEEITAAVERLEHAVPREIRKALAPVRHLAQRAAHTARRAEAKAEAVTHALHRFEGRVDRRLHAAEHAIEVTLPREIGHIRARERTIEHDIGSLRDAVRGIEDGAIDTWRWLNSHRTSAAMGVFTGVVAWALTRLGWGVLRCREWQRLGRSLTCSDASILRDLLGLVTGILASQISLEEFIRAAQAVETEAVDALHVFIQE